MRLFDRGNAAPETALVLSFTLLILFGCVQLATTTFYQVSADGATFVASHDTVQSLGSPTSANQAVAASAASGTFSKILAGSVAVLNPTSSTFETDISQQVPGISALGNPAALTVSSRQIEESSGTAGANQLPPAALDCSLAAENIVNNKNNQALGTVTPIVNKAIGLTQASGLVGAISINNGTQTALNLTPATVVTELNDVNAVATGLKQTVTNLQGLTATLTSTLGVIPGIGAFLTPILNAVASNVQTAVANALGGTFATASSLASVNAAIQNIPGLGSVLAALVVPVVDTALQSNGTGLFGANGPLVALNTAETNLDKLDAAIPSCPKLPVIH